MSTSIAVVRDTGRQYLKVDVITDAYSRMRISGLTVQPTPEDLELALTRLEDMLAEWESRNIVLSYNFEDEPDPNSLTNIKAAYKSALATNLAILLIPDFNKQVPPVLYNQAASGLDNISGRVALERLNQVPYPRRMPVGSGNSLRWNRWNRFYRDNSYKPNVSQSETMFVGDINDYVESFDAYLNEAEIISSHSIQVDSGLRVVSDAISSNQREIDYRLEATSANNEFNTNVSQVTIIVTTSSGRVETRRIFFSIERATTS